MFVFVKAEHTHVFYVPAVSFNTFSVSLSQAKIDTPPVTAIGAKAAPVMASKAAQPQLTGIGTVHSIHTHRSHVLPAAAHCVCFM